MRCFVTGTSGFIGYPTYQQALRPWPDRPMGPPEHPAAGRRIAAAATPKLLPYNRFLAIGGTSDLGLIWG